MVKQWKKSLDGDDVQAEAEDALEKDISQMSPASNSVAANLDGGVAAVDWSSKTFDWVGRYDSGTEFSYSGSGYILAGYFYNAFNTTTTLTIDEYTVFSRDMGANPFRDLDDLWNTDGTTGGFGMNGPIRFDSSIELTASDFVDDQVVLRLALD